MNQAPQNMDHLNETMLYKFPGPHEMHGGHFDYVIVPEAYIEEAKAQGWHLTTAEARAAHDKQKADEQHAIIQKMEGEDRATSTPAPAEPVNSKQENAGQPQDRELVDLNLQEQTAPPTYDEMKTKATQLGLEYPGNISKAALLAMITAKLAEQV